jgi:ATP-dependent Clp protease ATP-binding subunit ClpB
MVRIDMSEYMEKHSVARLIGAPPGYVGYDEGGQLTEQVRRRPYSVILFDEIEKAHPDVFNLLLQVLDDGRLTDGQGRVVDFRNAILVMTSNLGSQYIVEPGLDQQTVKDRVMAAVQGHFRPEFLNRVDDIIVFTQLTEADLLEIVDIQLERVVKRLAERRITFEISTEAKKALARQGYDPLYGARPLKRVIQTEVLDRLAMEILEGRLHEGTIASVDYNGESFDFREVLMGEAVA